MMGPGHALSGAAAWFVVAPVVSSFAPTAFTPAQVLVGAAVCSGAALLPDIDSPPSTIARSFGPFTWLIAKVVNAVSAGFHNATKTRREDFITDGHRTLTHTLLGAFAAAAGVAALCGFGGKWAVVGLLFFLVGLAIRGLLGDWARKQGWIGVTLTSGALAWMAAQTLPEDSYWWLSATVFTGIVLHLIGDCITKDAVPFIAPISFRGKAWWEFGPPGFLRIKAGGLIETAVLMPLFGIATLAGITAYALGGWGILFAQIGFLFAKIGLG